MKRTALVFILFFVTIAVIAQDEKESDNSTGGFRKDLLFTGGSLNIGYFSGVTVLGANPQLGYSVAKWLDAGITFGFTYTSQGLITGEKFRNTIIGPGAFVRLFPVDFLFATLQYEHNFIRQKYINPGFNDQINKVNAGSLLAGLGYTSGRESRNSAYYYLSVSIDLLNNVNSPYRTAINEVYPVVNAGFNIPLFQGSRRR